MGKGYCASSYVHWGGGGGAVSQRLSCPLVGVAIGTHHFGEPATPDGLGGALGGALVLPVRSAQ
jgi:hypothetical protein